MFRHLFVLAFFLGITTSKLLAQSNWYYGGEASFGVRTFALKSNINQLHGLNVLEEGANIGIVAGNSVVRGRLILSGFYYSAAKVPQTIDVVESGALFNFYPISLLQRRQPQLNFFLNGGLYYSRVKFYGYYLEKDGPINYSTSEAPYLGKNLITSLVGGAGIEWRIPGYEFLSLFAEGHVAIPMAVNDHDEFKKTNFSNICAINIGVSFGSGL